MKRVLLVSPYFPPATLAGVHRARHLAKHLNGFGWTPRVLTVDQSFYEEALDPDLARLLPDTIDIKRVGAIRSEFSRQVGIGDLTLRSFRHIAEAIEEEIAVQRPDLVLLTGGPFYVLLHAGRVAKHGIPVVLDFQDPWVSAEGALRPLVSKGGLAYRFARILEPRAVRHASAITSVSQRQNDEMLARYPALANIPMAAIPIGGDPEDFDVLREKPPLDVEHELKPGMINLSYVGTALPRANETLTLLLRAVKRLEATEPGVAARLRLNFVGTSNQPDAATGEGPVEKIARAEGVSHLVNETPKRVPFLHALSLLANSEGLLLIGSDEPHYTASKIYPALMSGTPFLSLFHGASSAHRILLKAGGGISFAFDDRQSLSALVDPITEGLARLAKEPGAFGLADQAAYSAYTAKAVAARYATLFDQLLEERWVN